LFYPIKLCAERDLIIKLFWRAEWLRGGQIKKRNKQEKGQIPRLSVSNMMVYIFFTKNRLWQLITTEQRKHLE